MQWHTVQSVHRTPEGVVQGQVAVPEESPWFCGHFPQEPILPGIAQLAMVEDLVRLGFSSQYRIQEVEKVRFKKVIHPGDAVRVEVWTQDEEKALFAFQIQHLRDVACGGRAVFKKSKGMEGKL